MTTLNTIIEEEKPEDIEKWVRTLASSSNPRDIDLLIAKINVLRTTAMQRAYKAGEREADAKWEERHKALHKKHTDEVYQLGKTHQKELVRKEVEMMKYKGMKYAENGQPLTIRDGQKEVHNLALDTLLSKIRSTPTTNHTGETNL